jgi:hypothetical protein
VDQGTLLEEKIAGGRRFLERFAADGNPVQSAFWVKTAEEGIWFLYVVSDIFDRDGPAAAYRAVHASLQKLGKTVVASSEIKVIGPNNPIAKDVLEIMDHHPHPYSVSWGALGSLGVEEMHLYPPHFFTFTQANPMTTEEVGREIVRLMNRGPGILQPSHVTLKDGSSFNGVPFSLQLGSQKAVVAQFVADGEAAPRLVRLDEIASIA